MLLSISLRLSFKSKLQLKPSLSTNLPMSKSLRLPLFKSKVQPKKFPITIILLSKSLHLPLLKSKLQPKRCCGKQVSCQECPLHSTSSQEQCYLQSSDIKDSYINQSLIQCLKHFPFSKVALPNLKANVLQANQTLPNKSWSFLPKSHSCLRLLCINLSPLTPKWMRTLCPQVQASKAQAMSAHI